MTTRIKPPKNPGKNWPLPFLKKIQHFALFLKLIRKILLFLKLDFLKIELSPIVTFLKSL